LQSKGLINYNIQIQQIIFKIYAYSFMCILLILIMNVGIITVKLCTKHLMSRTAYSTLLTLSTSDLSLTNDAHNLSDTVIAATLIKLTFFFIRIVMMT